MFFQLSALTILLVFYGIYLFKLVSQSRQSIKTDQMGTGNKPKRVLVIEQILRAATALTGVLDVSSVFLVKEPPPVPFRIAGLVSGILAVGIFALATAAMKLSWRVGIPEEKTELVTGGIYRWSRNPAFAAFDLLYLSICLMFFNVPLLCVSLWAAVMLHLQILQEEEHMRRMFGKDYTDYAAHTCRYLGRKIH